MIVNHQFVIASFKRTQLGIQVQKHMNNKNYESNKTIKHKKKHVNIKTLCFEISIQQR
jgi:hypothetical protein